MMKFSRYLRTSLILLLSKRNVSTENSTFGSHDTGINHNVAETTSRNVIETVKTGTTQHAIADDTSLLKPLTTISGTSTFTGRALIWPDKCDVMLCETGEGNDLVNATACSDVDRPVIYTTRSVTVRFMAEADEVHNRRDPCVLKITTDRTKYINITARQLSHTFTGKFKLKLKLTNEAVSFATYRILDVKMLKNVSVSYLSSSVSVCYQSYNQHQTQVVTLNVDVKEGVYVKDLPVVMLSNTVGYVTSPGFVRSQPYPNNYVGVFNINITRNESVLVNIFQIKLASCRRCIGDYVVFKQTCLEKYESYCACKHNIMAYVLHCSFRISFHTDSAIRGVGFKMMFAVLPSSQEPEKLPSKLFNCSVPSFHSFKPVFSCNMLRECENGEDEQDCGHRNNDCGMENSIDTGTKCYVLALHQRHMTWFDAHKDCIRRGQRLAILESYKDFSQFKSYVPPVVDLKGYFLGIQLMERRLPVSITWLYRNIWQWVDGRTVFSVQIFDHYENSGSCALYDPWLLELNSVSCHKKYKVAAFVCEVSKKGEELNTTRPSEVISRMFVALKSVLGNVSVVHCPSGHVTKDFLSCDVWADCYASISMTSCSIGSVTVPMFVCQRSGFTVHYTLVCDHMQHCSDNSDEEFCKYPECSSTSIKCRNGQCIHAYQQCDSKLDCYDGSDEVLCLTNRHSVVTSSPPGLIYMDGRGNFRMEQINGSADCPPTHILCPRGHCLPVYLRCNGVDDCMGDEDEVGCNSYKCHGFYRCRGSKTCLHPEHVCDGVHQCPEQDDELLCDLVCPDECRCQGLAFVCSSKFSANSHLHLRFLDASGSNMTLSDIRDNIHLVAFRLSRCHMLTMSHNPTFPNLWKMDLSWNKLYELDMQYFHSLLNLKQVVLTGNPLVQITYSEPLNHLNLEILDLSYTHLKELSRIPLANFPYLKLLNISWSKIVSITDRFHFNSLLETLDLRGCDFVKFPKNLLRHLTFLRTVHAENYKLCCEAMLPVNFDPRNCHAKQDLLTSCEDLLKSNSYRLILWMFVAMSLFGNVLTLGTRMYQHRKNGHAGSFNVFVTNLSMSDLFMGVYLGIIGTADLIFHGHYLWRDDEWKNSVACKVAGFFCLMSSEVSAFIICLITLDRFLVLRCPLGGLYFRCRSAITACGVAWAVGIFIAVFPLLSVTTDWKFYSQTGICIPLPFTSRETFLGYDYSFGISILLNLVLFLLIAVGQAFVYLAVRANSMPSSTNTQARDAAIARRLLTVVVSDFLCWFPMGFLGLLASTGTPIPGELNVAMATFVLPVNSALNPFLYTFNLLMEKRRKDQYEKLMKRLQLERRDRKSKGKFKKKDISKGI